MNPLLLTDFYKVGHPFQYPENTCTVYSNLTARKSRLKGVDKMVFFGAQYFYKKYLVDYFNNYFFKIPKELVIEDYKRRIRTSMGSDLTSYQHIEALHDLGYLPIRIKSLPEGSRVPMRVPVLTIVNTLPEFYWLTNFIESLMSAMIWQPCTSATLADVYHQILTKYAKETGMSEDFVQWQGHDFSFRGMSSLESAVLSGMGHLLSFTGTDTIPAIDALERYYKADADEELIGGSVPATEHSVMCSGEKDNEIDTFKRLITEVYPAGIVSIVSDTWDLWKVVQPGGICDMLKKEILARDGKVVIRPDSGDPVDIICGTDRPGWMQEKVVSISEAKGVVELLWEVFGGTINDKGYKVLDPHIGVIYGDSITLDRAIEICERLKAKGFASQVVFGIGSFTYQYNTRDTFGMAMKATYVEVLEDVQVGTTPDNLTWSQDVIGREIFKDPVTDDGTKKSATGLLLVSRDWENDSYVLHDKCTWAEEAGGELETVFEDGQLVKEFSLSEIRNRLHP